MSGAISEEAQRQPLVTFAVFAYNQEEYIQKAIDGALSQDYPNLEIVISDDASTDGTWEIIQSVVNSYRGPHAVTVRRNHVNAGIAGHVNQVFDIAQGELIVVAAGDDISYPHRTTRLVEAWQREGEPKAALHSSSRVMNLEGLPGTEITRGRAADPAFATLRSFVDNDFHSVLHGATAAYTPSLISSFGHLTSDFEDAPLTFRALLAGRLIYVDDVLLDYRTGQGVSRQLRRTDRVHVSKWVHAQVARIRCHRLDYATHCELTGLSEDRRISKSLRRLERRFDAARGMGSASFMRNLIGVLSIPINGTLRDRLYVMAVYFGFKP